MSPRPVRSWPLVMAALVSLVMLVGLAPSASAVTGPIGDFRLNGSLRNAAGTPVTLARIGAGQFQVIDVNGVPRTAFVFDKGEGLRLSNVPTTARSKYSIDIYFHFDQVSVYRRILGFGPGISDPALYVHDGHVALYPNVQSGTAVIAAGEWVHVLVTRGRLSKKVKVYVDAVLRLTWTDSAGQYRLAGGGAAFFKDDMLTMSASGAVKRIKVFDHVIAPS